MKRILASLAIVALALAWWMTRDRAPAALGPPASETGATYGRSAMEPLLERSVPTSVAIDDENEGGDGDAASRQVAGETGAALATGSTEVRAGGTVLFPRDFIPERIEFVQVTAAISRPAGDLPLGEAAVDAAGAWELLLSLPGPLDATSEVRFRLWGGGLAPQDRSRSVAVAGPWTVDFEPVLGDDLWFLVVDSAGEMIPEASIRMDWVASRLVLEARAHESGYLFLPGAPAGVALVTVQAPGYATVSGQRMTIPAEEGVSHQFVLTRGRELRGRVTWAGEPVEDFELLWWAAGRPGSVVRRTFEGRAAGEFELADAPEGALELAARAAQGQGRTEVPDKGSRPVEIELEADRALRGWVETAQGPARGATVQAWRSESGIALVPASSAGSTKADGTFVLVDVAVDADELRVTLDGYAESSLPLTPAQEDVGCVTLQAPVRARIVLEGAESARRFLLEGIHGTPLAPTPFPDAGVLELELAHGDAHFAVQCPDGTAITFTMALDAGAKNERAIEVGDALLVVRVEDELAQRVSGADLLRPRQRHRALLGPDGEARMEHLAPGEGTLVLVDASGWPVHEQAVRVEPGSNLIEVAAGDTSGGARLLLPDGSPVVGADVTFFGQDGSILATRRSGEDGELTVQPDHVGARAMIEHEELGFAVSNLWRPGSDAELPELVFDPSLDLTLSLTCAAGPVSGARVRIGEGASGLLFGSEGRSNENGVVLWSAVGAGEYQLRVEKAGHWTRFLKVAPGSHAIVLPKVGSLTIRVNSQQGLALAQVPLELRPLDLPGETVSAWLEQGRVTSIASSLHTDVSGTITLEGLPEGRYALSVGDPSLGAVDAEVLVIGAEARESSFVLP